MQLHEIVPRGRVHNKALLEALPVVLHVYVCLECHEKVGQNVKLGLDWAMAIWGYWAVDVAIGDWWMAGINVKEINLVPRECWDWLGENKKHGNQNPQSE